MTILLAATAPTLAAARQMQSPSASVQSPLPTAAVTHVRAILAAEMGRAGPFSGAYVVDLTTGAPLFALNADSGWPPASVEKLYTLSTALARFGVGARLQTTLYGAGQADAAGVWHGNLYLRGGGDPTFGSAAFDRAAYGTGATVGRLVDTLLAKAQLLRVDGSIVGDESLFDARRGDPANGYRAGGDLSGSLSGLAFDRGRSGGRGSPAAYAASQVAAALRSAGVRVTGRSISGLTPAAAIPLASVASPPLSVLAGLTALNSDNYFAEMLLKDLGASFGGGGSTARGARVVRSWLATFGIRPQIVDGSGLSRSDRTSPRQVVRLLASLTGDLAGVGTALRDALPIAGRTGTLRNRMRGSAAAGRCEAKTGTLSGVSALAGWCGRRVAFAFLMDRVDVTRARALQDTMTEALATLANY